MKSLYMNSTSEMLLSDTPFVSRAENKYKKAPGKVPGAVCMDKG